ncbi:MAG: DegT/DnrJ/EryC1/StrS family aminotransferase [Nitrospinaceae bacterium]
MLCTVNPAIHLGLKPVFVDVEPGALNLDPEKIEEKITPRTRVLLPVHFAGHPCDLDALQDIAQRRGLTIIEDAAHALGARYKGRPIGSHGHPTAFSFYANKNITTAEGGMLTLDDDVRAEEARVLALQGISKDAWKRYTREGFAHYELQAPGYKFNMADLNAALGIHQFRKAARFQDIRNRYAALYDAALGTMEELEIFTPRAWAESARHLYVVALNLETLSISRDQFLNEMQSRGIGMAVHYRALHLQPYFRANFHYSLEDLPIASSYSERVLSLPLYPRMSGADVARVIETVEAVVRRFRR